MPWLVLMQKSVRERKVVKDKCSPCSCVGSDVPCSSTACGELGSSIDRRAMMDNRNEEQTHVHIYPALPSSFAQMLASCSATYSSSIYICSKGFISSVCKLSLFFRTLSDNVSHSKNTEWTKVENQSESYVRFRQTLARAEM